MRLLMHGRGLGKVCSQYGTSHEHIMQAQEISDCSSQARSLRTPLPAAHRSHLLLFFKDPRTIRVLGLYRTLGLGLSCPGFRRLPQALSLQPHEGGVVEVWHRSRLLRGNAKEHPPPHCKAYGAHRLGGLGAEPSKPRTVSPITMGPQQL